MMVDLSGRLPSDIGGMIRRYRRALMLSQEELGDAIGYDPSFICRLENGRRRIRNPVVLGRLADVLGLDTLNRRQLFEMAGWSYPSAEEVWSGALAKLQVQLTRANYETWLKGTTGLSLVKQTLTVAVPSAFAKEWLTKRIEPLVKRAVAGILGYEAEVQYLVSDSSPRAEALEDSRRFTSIDNAPSMSVKGRYATEEFGNSSLNPKYTFSAFIVGSSNLFAHAAAVGVAESPAHSYNPLFVYGGVGLGKTHLLQAIAHRCRTDC